MIPLRRGYTKGRIRKDAAFFMKKVSGKAFFRKPRKNAAFKKGCTQKLLFSYQTGFRT